MKRNNSNILCKFLIFFLAISWELGGRKKNQLEEEGSAAVSYITVSEVIVKGIFKLVPDPQTENTGS